MKTFTTVTSTAAVLLTLFTTTGTDIVQRLTGVDLLNGNKCYSLTFPQGIENDVQYFQTYNGLWGVYTRGFFVHGRPQGEEISLSGSALKKDKMAKTFVDRCAPLLYKPSGMTRDSTNTLAPGGGRS